MMWFDLSLLGLAVIVCFVSYRHARTSLGHLSKAKALSERSSELLAQAQTLVVEARRLSNPGLAEAQRVATEANARERERRGLS